MFNLNDQAVRGGNFCLSKAGLAMGSANATAKIAETNSQGIDFVIDGVVYHQADEDSSTVVLPTETLTALYTNIFLVSINASKDIEVISGTEVLTADLDAERATLAWPTPTNGYCPIGAILIDAGSGDFAVGSDALTGDTETVEYIDLFSVPAEPITDSAS